MTTTMAEPEWDEDARDTALALDLFEASLCPLCGRPQWICQSPDAEGMFEADLPTRCHASTALMIAQDRVTEETNPQHRALLWSVRERTG